MALDFQELRKQVIQLGQEVAQRQGEREARWELALGWLRKHANQPEALRRRVQEIVELHDPNLRCALPLQDALHLAISPPPAPQEGTILAADGSQITPDRHAEVAFGLVNVGAVCMRIASSDSPSITIRTQLHYSEDPLDISEFGLQLNRDLNERKILAELAPGAEPPVFSFTDGPMELWGAKESRDEGAAVYQQCLAEYQEALDRLHQISVATAGYVDKPAANLVVRLLEVAEAPQDQLGALRKWRPLHGLSDARLYTALLAPGQRSTVFAIQSHSAASYEGAHALHFFYLNVGPVWDASLARVEIPAWVAQDAGMLGNLHAILLKQCQMMGALPYPYLLHRAHETARVTPQETEQVTQLVAAELGRRGLSALRRSSKGAVKDLPGRTRL
ncbi:MAG: DNA double-strand break repair nuclease NurA [Anaerolineales bacterium]|nr:DNA double-strand break repair nuclease NurA [Anaerolineales bacterium]